MAKTIVVSNLKGGCGKSFTVASLGMGLARQGKRVLLLDTDSQHSLTVSLGIAEPEKLPVTLSSVMANIINDTEYNPTEGIIHHTEGADILPSNITLASTELSLVPIMGRETILRQYIDRVKDKYEYIIVDTSPSPGLMTINALVAADSVIIPVMPKYLDAKGMELLLKTISQVRRVFNPKLSISGILLTMVDKRASFTQEIITLVENAYGSNIRIFNEHIPRSVRATESTAQGVSIYSYEQNGKVAKAYSALVKEVLDDAA